MDRFAMWGKYNYTKISIILARYYTQYYTKNILNLRYFIDIILLPYNTTRIIQYNTSIILMLKLVFGIFPT